LNCTIPEFVNSSVGSFAGTSGLDATIAWPRSSKISGTWWRIFGGLHETRDDSKMRPIFARFPRSRKRAAETVRIARVGSPIS